MGGMERIRGALLKYRLVCRFLLGVILRPGWWAWLISAQHGPNVAGFRHFSWCCICAAECRNPLHRPGQRAVLYRSLQPVDRLRQLHIDDAEVLRPVSELAHFIVAIGYTAQRNQRQAKTLARS